MSILKSLSGAVLREAAAIKEQIETLEVKLARLIHADGISVSVSLGKEPSAKKKGGMSAAGKAKIAAAQKARWAKFNAAKKSQVVKPAAKKQSKMSPAARAKIAAAQKARWAKVNAAKAAAK